MLRYLRFLVKCGQNRFSFFSYPAAKKAKILAENNLSFWAGLYFLELKEYGDATICFEKAHAYKHLIVCYEKQGLYHKALTLAEEKKYYERGAKIALHLHYTKKAAYFYSFFNIEQAALLYSQENAHYEAGFCYLQNYQPLKAIETFKKCNNYSEQTRGLKEVEEFALVLYFTKQYDEAFKIFMALDDYYSALECAKHLHDISLIASVRELIGYIEAEKSHYTFAAQCVEPYNKSQAVYYYNLDKAYNESIRILLEEGHYEKAIQICLLDHNLNKAYEIASTYNPELLSS